MLVSTGLGVILLHKYTDASQKAIAQSSRTLSIASGKKIIVKLAIIFGIQKFHKFIHGRLFKLQIDHCPLLIIDGVKKGSPVQ